MHTQPVLFSTLVGLMAVGSAMESRNIYKRGVHRRALDKYPDISYINARTAEPEPPFPVSNSPAHGQYPDHLGIFSHPDRRDDSSSTAAGASGGSWWSKVQNFFKGFGKKPASSSSTPSSQPAQQPPAHPAPNSAGEKASGFMGDFAPAAAAPPAAAPAATS